MNAVIITTCPACLGEISIEQATEEVRHDHRDIISCPACDCILEYSVEIHARVYQQDQNG